MSLSPVEKIEARVAYGLNQAPRLAWYLGHGLVMRRLAARHSEPVMRSRATSPMPPERTLFRDLQRLFARDLANVEAGIYPVPETEDGSLARRLESSRLFFADLPSLARRRASENGQEVFEEGLGEGLPRYYRQNFHFQTDGWLSESSAKIYDMQVEVLFAGAANAMRRQALVPIAEWMRGRDPRGVALLDLACGTGRFLREVKRAYPAVSVTGLDLSEAYLGEARRTLADFGRTAFVPGAGEAMPFPDASFDVVTNVFLFHELPPKIRGQVAREVARVLKPGGLFVFVDSLQQGDMNGYDGLLERFPEGFHEPYYAGYLEEDLEALFGEAGLSHRSTDLAWLSKVMAFERRAG